MVRLCPDFFSWVIGCDCSRALLWTSCGTPLPFLHTRMYEISDLYALTHKRVLACEQVLTWTTSFTLRNCRKACTLGMQALSALILRAARSHRRSNTSGRCNCARKRHNALHMDSLTLLQKYARQCFVNDNLAMQHRRQYTENSRTNACARCSSRF